MKGNTIYLAECETPSFSFRAVGLTREEAYRGITDALNEHGLEYDLDYGWWEDMDIVVRAMRVGAGSRDGVQITPVGRSTV